MANVTDESLKELRKLLEAQSDPTYAPLLALVRAPCSFSGMSSPWLLSPGSDCSVCQASWEYDAAGDPLPLRHRQVTTTGYWNNAPRGALAGALLTADTQQLVELVCGYADFSDAFLFTNENPDQAAVDALTDRLEEDEMGS